MKELPFESSGNESHVVLKVAYQGRRFAIRVGVHVFAVTPTGGTDPNTKLPGFNLNLSPVVHVSELEKDGTN
jgi:hypothetical protein